jgi:hypothetical protein
VSPFGRYASISPGFTAVASLGGGADCAFTTTWVTFDVIAPPSCAD